MGSERLISILQDVDSNYDTGYFHSTFNAIQKVTERERTLERSERKIGLCRHGLPCGGSYSNPCFTLPTVPCPITMVADTCSTRLVVPCGTLTEFGAELVSSKLVPTLVDPWQGNMFPELVEKQEYVSGYYWDEEESFRARSTRTAKVQRSGREGGCGQDRVWRRRSSCTRPWLSCGFTQPSKKRASMSIWLV
jgi:hypothetical protein